MIIDIHVRGYRFYLSLDPLPKASSGETTDQPPTQLQQPMRTIGFWQGSMLSDAAYVTSEHKDG